MKINGTDIALIICTTLLVMFIITMIVTYWVCGDIPQEFAIAVVALAFGEYGFGTMIYRAKHKNKWGEQ